MTDSQIQTESARRSMTDDNLPQRTLKTTFWLAAFFVLLFEARGDRSIALGLTIGAAVGLFSLWSLLVVVPKLFRPGNSVAKLWLGMAAIMKLPIYCVVLSIAMTSKHIAPLAVFCGVALVPMVIFLKTVGAQLVESVRLPVGE